MIDAIEAEVLQELKRITLLEDFELEQRLYHDLGITGDDAYELLENIQKRFGTNFRKLDFHKYFSADPDFITGLIERWFPSVITEKPVTIRHLVDVVRAGHWFDPRS